MNTRNLHGYIVPQEDPHQSEYVAACFKRREALSGFTGSAGTAALTQQHAALWTDGRYWLQAANQLDSKHWTLMRQGLPETPTMAAWFAQVLPQGARIGVDPTLLSQRE